MTEGPYPALWGAGRKRGWACTQIPDQGARAVGSGGQQRGWAREKLRAAKETGLGGLEGESGVGHALGLHSITRSTMILHILDEGREGLGGERRRVWRGKEGLK